MNKYSYNLNGTLYFIYLTADEKLKFEARYGIALKECE